MLLLRAGCHVPFPEKLSAAFLRCFPIGEFTKPGSAKNNGPKKFRGRFSDFYTL